MPKLMASVQTPTQVSPQSALPCQPSLGDQSAPPTVRFLWLVKGRALCSPDPDSASTSQEIPTGHGTNLWRRGPGASEKGFSKLRCALRCDFRTCGQNRSHFASRRRQPVRSGPRLRRLRLYVSRLCLTPKAIPMKSRTTGAAAPSAMPDEQRLSAAQPSLQTPRAPPAADEPFWTEPHQGWWRQGIGALPRRD